MMTEMIIVGAIATYNFLNGLSGILSLTAIIIAIIFFFHERKDEKEEIKRKFNDRLSRACRLLLVDIETWLLEIIEDLPYRENVYSLQNYRSVINSGLVTYLKKDTIVEVTKLYHYIEVHNKRIFEMNDMINSVMNSVKYSSDVSLEREIQLKESHAWVLNVQELTLYEDQIRKRLCVVKDKLDDEIKDLNKDNKLCSNCKKENPMGAKHCMECGSQF